MAARQALLSDLDQNLLLQLRSIASSDIDNFDDLSDQDKKVLFTAALSVGYASDLLLFYDLKLHPENIGLAPLPKEELATATVNAQVLAANVELYLTDQDAKEKIKAQIDAALSKESASVRSMVNRMVGLQIAIRQAQIMSLRATEKISRDLSAVSRQVNEKAPPQPQIAAISSELIQTVIPQVERQQGISITQIQKEIASTRLATLIIAGTATGDVDLTKPELRDELIQIAISDIPQVRTTVTDVYRQIEQSVVTLTSRPEFDSSDPERIQVTPEVLVTNITSLSLPALPPTALSLTYPTDFEERLETVQTLATKFVTSVSGNSRSDEVMGALTATITREQEKILTAALISDNLLTRVAPTREGAAAAKVIEELDPVNPHVDAATVRLVSMGLVMRAVEEKVAANPDSATAKVLKENPSLAKKLKTGAAHLENLNNDLGKEVSQRIRAKAATEGKLPPHLPIPTKPGPLSGLASQYQNVTNRISGFLPGRAGQIFNAVAHPIQFLQGKIGNYIGNQIVGRFKHWVAEKVVSKIANETVKKAAEFILKKGLQEGVKLLAKEGLKRGLQAVAQLANVAPGAGILLAIAIEAAFYIGGKTIGAVMSGVNSISRALTGEDFDLRVAAAAPLALVGTVGGALAGVGAASMTAAASAGVILLGSVLAGSFLYVTVIAVAPIISSIAHLESASSVPYSVISGGEVPEGCPSGWPVASGYVTQGPRTTSTHRNVEAIDIGLGQGIPIIATHNGLARYDPSLGPYGNFVDVTGTCNGIGFTTRYAHMLTGAFAGEKLVAKGEVIGYVNNTGNSTGSHVHYEIRGGNLGDINQFLPKRVNPGCINTNVCNVVLP